MKSIIIFYTVCAIIIALHQYEAKLAGYNWEMIRTFFIFLAVLPFLIVLWVWLLLTPSFWRDVIKNVK